MGELIATPRGWIEAFGEIVKFGYQMVRDWQCDSYDRYTNSCTIEMHFQIPAPERSTSDPLPIDFGRRAKKSPGHREVPGA